MSESPDKPKFNAGSAVHIGLALAGVVAFCLLSAVLAFFGVGPSGLAVIALLVVLGLCAVSGRSDAPQTPMSNGIAAGIEGLSAVGLFGIVGAVFVFGPDGLAVLLGLAAGFVLNLTLVAPRLCTAPVRSLPDFLSLRYRSEPLRYLTLGIMILVTVLFVAAQFVAGGLIVSQGLGIESEIGVLLGLLGVLILTVPGGMKSTRAGQVTLALVAAVSLAIATIWLVSAKTGLLVPQFAYGGLFSDIAAAEDRLGVDAPFGGTPVTLGISGMLLLTLSLAVGAAVMPHSVSRVTTEGSPAKTQDALRRALIMFVVLATALPALAVLARAEVLGLFIAAKGMLSFDGLPPALAQGATVCGADFSAAREACAEYGLTAGYPASALGLDPQAVTMALPSLTGASAWVLALVVLLGLAVVIMAAAGALGVLSAALASRVPETEALGSMRIAVFVIALGAAVFAIGTDVDLIRLGLWAFSLIGAALVGPLILGLWWHRATEQGALAGMIGGFGLTAAYIVGATWGFDFLGNSGDEWSWFGVSPLMAGGFGIVASLALTVLGSLASPPPHPEQVALVEALDPYGVKANPEAPE